MLFLSRFVCVFWVFLVVCLLLFKGVLDMEVFIQIYLTYHYQKCRVNYLSFDLSSYRKSHLCTCPLNENVIDPDEHLK